MRSGGLGIVILAYGGGGEYRAVLRSLRGERPTDARVVVVHNPASAEEPRPAPEEGVELILSPTNGGYAGGMNLGLDHLRGKGFEQALLLTHDATLRPGCLPALLAASARHPDLGALGPVLLRPDTDEPFSYGGSRRRDGLTPHRKTPGPAGDGISPVDWIDGGAMLLSARGLAATGGFDERFWSYCEDADLCLRLHLAGFGVGVVLGAQADQEPGSAKRPGAWAYLTVRNGAACARRAGGPGGLARFAARAVLASGLALARSILRTAGIRPGSPRETWALAVGGIRGLLDYRRGRWGPPPRSLPGLGDVQGG